MKDIIENKFSPEKRLIEELKKLLHGKLPLKEEEIELIRKKLKKRENIPPEKIDEEILYFFTYLKFPDYYFKITSLDEIVRTIEIIQAYKIIGGDVYLETTSPDKLKKIYIAPAKEEIITQIEQRNEKEVIDCIKENKFFELEMHKTKGKYQNTFLNVYMIEKSNFIETPENYFKTKFNQVKKLSGKKEKSLLEFWKTKSKKFIEKSLPDRISRYFLEFLKIKDSIYPVITLSTTSDKKEYRIMVSFPDFYLNNLLPSLMKIFYKYNVIITRYYLTTSLLNNKRFISISYYISSRTYTDKVETILKEIYNCIITPHTEVDRLYKLQKFDYLKIFFINSFAEFAHQFIRARDPVLDAVHTLIKDNPELEYLFSEFQRKIETEIFSLEAIIETLSNNPDISEKIYQLFESKFKNPVRYETLKKKINKDIEETAEEIKKELFIIGINFIENIKKTNFFKHKKIALSFSLESNFLPSDRYPSSPYRIIFIYGKGFKGFHVRFQNIARGGIRILKSRDRTAYLKNSDEAFMEVYNLAYTQEKKNKDIPEGGAKGIILPHYEIKETDTVFKNYIDAMLDLMIKGEYLPKNEVEDILFLGPDEGSAHLMDWASLRAKERKYKLWRSFTTGKSSKLGGISHIDYGITTTGTHEYVLQILKKLNLEEKDITKVQTGGPDGDLGSNEILISKDKTIAVIDGSGVAYDPEGLDRAELVKLAKKRIPIVNFDKKKLTKRGFVVSINEKNLKLKEFPEIKTGLELRDQFHFLIKADLFVPAGGRPYTINITNWQRMLDKDGKPKYKIIVEGANLFITQDARIELEKKGIILIKDSSANKGGVTSSSLEVLVSLVLDENKYEKLMCKKDTKESDFRKKYIKEILEIIKKNARREFEVLWNIHKSTGEPISVISDKISALIVNLTNSLRNSNIFKNKFLYSKLLKNYLPETLLDILEFDEILKRIPEDYKNSIIARESAREIVYNTGLWAQEIKEKYGFNYNEIVDGYFKALTEIENYAEQSKDRSLKEILMLALKERSLQILLKNKS